MPRKEEPVKAVCDGSRDGDRTETHPELGEILVSKRSHGGACRLYGTPLDFHPSTISITIRHSERIHGLSHDRYYARGLPITEIEMSAAQFTEMLMGMNEGGGIPCTIRATESDQNIPAIPFDDMNEVERIEQHFTDDVEELNAKVRKMRDRAEELLSQPRLKKADKNELLGLISLVQRFYWDHSPFVMKSFRESVQNGVNVAKRELDAFIGVMAQQTGIDALRSMSVPDQMRKLAGPSDEQQRLPEKPNNDPGEDFPEEEK